MADRVAAQREMYEEADSFTGGPGVVATKSQARGSLGGIVIGAIIGAALGLIVGLFIGSTTGLIISMVAFTFAGATAGGVSGGFVRPKKTVPPSGADIR
jgi:hypothetical protein